MLLEETTLLDHRKLFVQHILTINGGRAVDRADALKILREICEVQRFLFAQDVFLKKAPLSGEYSIVFEVTLDSYSKNLIQPILDKHKLTIKQDRDSVVICSLASDSIFC